VTLTLLLTSADVPDVFAAEINVFSDLDATATLSTPGQAAAALSAVAGLTAELRVATDRAAEVIYVTSNLTANLRNATLRPSATIPATAGAGATADSRAADLAAALITVVASPQGDLVNSTRVAAALITAVASASGALQSRTRRTVTLIPALAEVFIRIPPRSLGAAASPAPGRSSSGSLTGGGRGTAGTATPASGR
jgi:hypothetical protein